MNAFLNFFQPKRGVHPPEHKAESTQLPIATLPLPEKLVLPLRQHIGHFPKVLVQVGDHVLKGQLLAEAEGTVSAAIHAPTSGQITAISDAVIPHPSGLPDLCITLLPDGKDTWIERKPQDWQHTDKHELVASLRNSGIVGMGGATFPTYIKLCAESKCQIHTLIINAAECEPYITCDDMLMRERADEIVQGIAIAQHLLGAQKSIIGIEDNKPQATKAMETAVQKSAMQTAIVTVPTQYPSGDARQLIKLVANIEVPHDKRATQMGVQVFNVATVRALYRFFCLGEPAISRVVTVTGNVNQPQNFEVLFGTPLPELLKAAGGEKPNTTHFIMGGPMMGFDLPTNEVPITKAANCIIAASPALFAPPPPAMPCIRCARCADACPIQLQPQELYWFAKSDNFEKARDYNLFDCIECGVCSYVCPSNIPLVQYYRYAKSEMIAQDKAKEAADLARERNEFRLARIEREKQERAQKHAERALGAKQDSAKQENSTEAPREKNDALEANNHAASSDATTKTQADDAKKAAIAAAIERAKAAKLAAQQAGDAPKNMTPTNPAVQQEIAEIDARRQHVGLEKAVETNPNIDAEKQAKIAAAIERAKVMKAAKEAEKLEKEP
ncbi:MAG TPA: electron transport complex subunit RsxC [Methylotenera sp.]|nr:electron transport complex subunit RsxC [Methylotenera sp.]HPH05859.1 electron transport complex subunit RsxC [Methylotenera sp.]HPN00641.1 electron transport complex subunit RsxC [Methylotenera sp.]